MYEVQLDMFAEFENRENPSFRCKDLDEMVKMIQFFMLNGYDVLVREIDQN